MENPQETIAQPVDYDQVLKEYLWGKTPTVQFDPAILDFHIRIKTLDVLNGIRGRLTFIVLVVIVMGTLSILSSCGSLLTH